MADWPQRQAPLSSFFNSNENISKNEYEAIDEVDSNIYDFFNIVEIVQEDSIIILKTDATEILQNGSM